MTKCDCGKTATCEAMTMGLDMKMKSLYLCDRCVKTVGQNSGKKCVIDARENWEDPSKPLKVKNYN